MNRDRPKLAATDFCRLPPAACRLDIMDHRIERITEAIREELSEMIGYEMADPRVGSAIVTEVQISPDKRHAMVRVRVPENSDTKAVLEALAHARNFLRRQLAARLTVYRIPELHFEADVASELGGKMEHLLKRIRKGRPRDPEPAG
ncbi:MAG TPA: 30S ribosome-binding factor RbfA [Bryobacteraceae bacterium]|nr:30S ribosome-binding factor RbfA [Bryobacteraceae bacterium]